MNWFKSLFCKHKFVFVHNIHGDEINECGGYRSVWKCSKCGKYQYRYDLKLDLKTELYNNYKEYYNNIYEKWKDDNKEVLDNMINGMIERSKQGRYSYVVILLCDEDTLEKDKYQRWIDENNLHCNIKLAEEKRWPTKNRYEFCIYWD